MTPMGQQRLLSASGRIDTVSRDRLRVRIGRWPANTGRSR